MSQNVSSNRSATNFEVRYTQSKGIVHAWGYVRVHVVTCSTQTINCLDLHPRNILLYSPAFSSWSTQEEMKALRTQEVPCNRQTYIQLRYWFSYIQVPSSRILRPQGGSSTSPSPLSRRLMPKSKDVFSANPSYLNPPLLQLSRAVNLTYIPA